MKKSLSVLFILICFTDIGFAKYILPVKNIVSSSASMDFFNGPNPEPLWKGNITLHYNPVFWYDNGKQLPTFGGISGKGLNSCLDYLIREFSYTVNDILSVNQTYYFLQSELDRLFSTSRFLDENAYITMKVPAYTTTFIKNTDPEVRSRLLPYRIYEKCGMIFFELMPAEV